ncbi:MAG: hypothetical protein HYZ28_01100 [Myxococcales bacterium]|nr:hypothetical protein [Myxococcales bacterium]
MAARWQGASSPASLFILLAALASACGKSACRGSAPAEVAVGPEGGSLKVAAGAGSVTIEVPAGALDEEVRLWARAVPERLPGAASPAVELGPHGTRFNKPVAIRFSPGPADVPPALPLASLKVATQEERRWAFLPTRLPSPGTFEGETSHFTPLWVEVLGSCGSAQLHRAASWRAERSSGGRNPGPVGVPELEPRYQFRW